MWSVNDGLSGNLRKPPETSGNWPRWFPTGFGRFSDSLLIQLFFLLIKKVLPETAAADFQEVSGRFPDNPSLTDHTVGCKFRQIYVQQFKTPVDKTGTVCCHFSSLEAEPATQNSRIVAYISLRRRQQTRLSRPILYTSTARCITQSSCPISPVFR